MKEGQNDMCYVTDESIVVVSSLFEENLRKKGHEVPYMADLVGEYAVHQFKESDGTKLNPTTKEGLKKAFEELVKETLGDKVDEVIVNGRWVNSLRAHTTSEQPT